MGRESVCVCVWGVYGSGSGRVVAMLVDANEWLLGEIGLYSICVFQKKGTPPPFAPARFGDPRAVLTPRDIMVIESPPEPVAAVAEPPAAKRVHTEPTTADATTTAAPPQPSSTTAATATAAPTAPSTTADEEDETVELSSGAV